MVKEEFINLGLTEELAIKAEQASQKELKSYIEKVKYDEINQTKIQLEDDIKQRDAQIEEIRKSTGIAEELQNKIVQLQAENKTKDTQYQAQIKDLKLNSAIKTIIADKAQDIDLVSRLFDNTRIVVSDDGKITGIDEQLKELQKDKPFLFKTGEIKTIYTPKNGEPTHTSLAETIATKMNEENTNNPYTNAWA